MKYRKLRYGEIIRFGDEYLHCDTKKWCVEKAGHKLVLAGRKYGPEIYNPYRRPIKAKSARPVRRGRPLNKLQAAIDSIVKEYASDYGAGVGWTVKCLREKLNQLAAL